MARSYIELSSSDGSINKKFVVVNQDYSIVLSGTRNVDRTVDGNIDVTFGKNLEIHNYVVRVRHTETETGYGSLDDLRALYKLNNPNGTPSNVITLKDHHYSVPGDEKYCYLLGDLRQAAIGAEIEGAEAWFFVPIKIQVIPS